MFSRRTLLRGSAASAGAWALSSSRAGAAEMMPGVSADEIKIGQTMAYSGPASAYGAIGRAEAAYFRMINETGGINGRKINFITLDDGYSPPKAVEQTRRLVEQEKVAFIFGSLGTPSNSATRSYLNDNKIPQIFIASGADKWADPKHYPWTMGYLPSYQTEAKIDGRAILAHNPQSKVAILYQNDDFGKDYLIGLKEGMGDSYKAMVVKEASFEVSEPTVDSQVISLQGSGADVFINIATPKFAAQAIRKAFDVGWKPTQYLTYVSSSIAAVLKPAGLAKSKGIISTVYNRDPSDPRTKDDPATQRLIAFFQKGMSGANLGDGNLVVGYGAAQTLVQVLKQCGNDLSRENVMRQATSLKGFVNDALLPGISINTSSDDYHPIKQLQAARFSGSTWEPTGNIMNG